MPPHPTGVTLSPTGAIFPSDPTGAISTESHNCSGQIKSPKPSAPLVPLALPGPPLNVSPAATSTHFSPQPPLTGSISPTALMGFVFPLSGPTRDIFLSPTPHGHRFPLRHLLIAIPSPHPLMAFLTPRPPFSHPSRPCNFPPQAAAYNSHHAPPLPPTTPIMSRASTAAAYNSHRAPRAAPRPFPLT